MITDFDNMIADLDEQIAAEENSTRIKDASHSAYSLFAKVASKRCQNTLIQWHTPNQCSMQPNASSMKCWHSCSISNQSDPTTHNQGHFRSAIGSSPAVKTAGARSTGTNIGILRSIGRN